VLSAVDQQREWTTFVRAKAAEEAGVASTFSSSHAGHLQPEGRAQGGMDTKPEGRPLASALDTLVDTRSVLDPEHG
jgi:hypothetical protein